MKSDYLFSRYTLLWIVLLCYFMPLVGLSAYGIIEFDLKNVWNWMVAGLLFSLFGSLAVFLFLTRWNLLWQMDQTIQENLSRTAFEEENVKKTQELLEKMQQENSMQSVEIEKLSDQVETLSTEKEKSVLQAQQAVVELSHFRKAASAELEQQQNQIRQFQETIAEQKILIEKKQQQTGMLETKVGDLTYEIKTLLKLAEAHSGPLYESKNNEPPSVPQQASSQPAEAVSCAEKQIASPAEASFQLKRCLDIAQKITGSHRFNSQINHLLDFSADSFAIDLRRLCDSLRSENGSAILLYTPKENQLLFANNQVKVLTGWSPEKFVQNFTEILVEQETWHQAISSLSMRSEAQVQLSFKTRSGPDLKINAHLGIIPTGIFRSNAIAVLY